MLAAVKKQESSELLRLLLRMYQEWVELRLDKRTCIKCQVCSLACPRGAVTVISGEGYQDITIDSRLCVFCEICAHFCPTGAVSLQVNGHPKTIFSDHQGLAPFLPKVAMDKAKCPEPCPGGEEGQVHWCRQQTRLVGGLLSECPKHCHRCLSACPRQAIALDPEGRHTLPEPDRCLRCTQCLAVCDYGSLTVSPQFRGELLINDQKCPPDCVKCVEACPVKVIVREGARVFRKTETCTYCGVCVNVCEDEAVTLIRREVVALPGEYSYGWEEAVRRLITGVKAR